MSAKRVRAAAVVAVLAATPLALASPAFASGAPHHPPASPGLTGAKRGAEAVLTQYTRRLGMIEARESSSPVINSTDLGLLQNATTADSAAIATDKSDVTAAATLAEVRAAVASGRTTLSEAVLDWPVVVAADRIEARDATLANEQTTLDAEASADTFAGKTVPPAVTTALAALGTEAAASTTAATAAVTVVTSVTAAPTPSAVRAARTSATGDLRVSRQDLAVALHDAALAAHLLAQI